MADWAKLDVGFFRHPQVISLTPQQQLGYIALILHAQEWETDGHVTGPALRVCGVTSPQAAAMEAAGLIRREQDGWQICGFARKQTSKAELDGRRLKASERQKRRRSHDAL